MNLRSFVPWYGKIAAKLILSRVPATYAFWHKHRMFSHGSMDEPKYAHDVYAEHFQRSAFARKRQGYVALELGPGDSAVSAIITGAYGAAGCYLIDAGDFATRNIDAYRRTARFLTDRGLAVPNLERVATLDNVLQLCNAQYKTGGLESLRSVPSASVDFVWSHAVLEHIRRDTFLPTMKELHRVLRSDGACSHRVDLKDHLGGGLNNMRLSSRWWETEWIAQSGFYTNRLRFSEMIEMFQGAGFLTEILAVSQWGEPAIRRQSLAREFRQLGDADLRINAFDVVLRPA